MELLNNLKNREPIYDARFHEMIMKFTIEQGGKMGTQSELERWEQGKFFSTVYEFYMYSAIIGLKNDYQIELPKESEKKKFIPISSWKPEDLVDFILMSVIAKSGIDFNELEYKEDKEVKEKISDIRSLLEQYANGGFDMIKSRYDEDPDFFENNDNCFLDLLDELSLETSKTG
jgi:hypothetical protein